MLDWLTMCRRKFVPGKRDGSPSFLIHNSFVAIGKIPLLSPQLRSKRTDCLSRSQQFDPMLKITSVTAAHVSHSCDDLPRTYHSFYRETHAQL